MKRGLIITFMLFSCFSFAQKHEIDLRFGYGFSNRNFQPYDPTYEEIRDPKTIEDVNIDILYKYQVWKKGLFVSGGVKYAKSKHYKPLVESVYGYHLTNIEMSKKRLELHLGIHHQFNFYEGKVLLDLGAHIVKRFYNSEISEHSQEFIHHESKGWIEYKYDLTTYYSDKYHTQGVPIGFVANKKLNAELNAQVKFKLFKDAYFGIGVSYSRNHIFFYDYTNEVRYYVGGSTTPTHTQNFLGLVDSDPNKKFGLREHFIYLNSGFTYKL